MAKRNRYSEEEKKQLIKEHKNDYLSRNRAKVNGKNATEELFNKLPLKEQWSRIYLFIRRNKTVVNNEINNTQIKDPLKSIKSIIDNLDLEQIKTLLDEFDSLRNYAQIHLQNQVEVEKKKVQNQVKDILKNLDLEKDAFQKIVDIINKK
ncbi:hypothetical protein [Proteiniphilum acetatigenes]|uniref:hypothetical protein n=1 Tax=Proteiniphilum acetatigenes TaxID=294710 RepID=UPI00037AC7F9|nr:hypothetical protein [Proteiniphilum acetatigenes]